MTQEIVICIFFITAVLHVTACVLQMSYDITHLKEHLHGARTFLMTTGPVMITSIQRHVEMATTAAERIEDDHEKLKRKLNSKEQEIGVLRKLRKLSKTDDTDAETPVKNVSTCSIHICSPYTAHNNIIDKVVWQPLCIEK